MVSHGTLENIADPYSEQLALMHLVLFYGKYVDGPITDPEKDAFVEEYRQFLTQSRGLSYRADYLLVSLYDRRYLQPGSPADQLMKNNPPIFQNSAYQVFKITGRP
jgi:hypothetical protein